MSIILEQFKALKKKFRKVQTENRELRKKLDRFEDIAIEHNTDTCHMCKPKTKNVSWD